MDELFTWGVIGIIFLLVVLGLGLWRDPVFRTRMMRSVMKKNYIILAIVSKDSKTVRQMTVNAEKDIVKVANSIWVIEGGRIYRKDKPQSGFFVGKNEVKWEEGVPTVYVYADSMKPTNFDQDDKTVVKPDEAGASILAFIANELLKGLIVVAEYKTFLIIIMVLALAAIGVGYMAWTEAGAAKQMSSQALNNTVAIMQHFNIQPLGIVSNESSNGVIVVKG